ncbi:C-type lectin domain family 4 member F-like [Tigriopus californicus]|nr:C-type lectin domain family 4 member F-like [Tigriopus californicus]
MRCKSTYCQGVAFNRDQSLCLYGGFQSDPTTLEGEEYIEVWTLGPLETYIITEDTRIATIPPNDCRLYPDWISKPNGKRYFFTSEYMPWKDQKEFCESRQARLATVKSNEDEEIVFELTAGYETWLGLTNRAGERCENESCNGKLFWSDGSMFQYDPAIYSKPMIGDSAHFCLRLRNVEYNDRDCSDSKAGLCEVVCS